MRVVFMGTPDFALFSLRALCESGENVVGVVTQPDKPKGRGYALVPPPVKVYAQARNIPVFQPATLKNGAFDETLKSLSPDVIAVAAYGKILPSSVLHMPPYGCVNVHGSLLPRYRGAAPMQRAILEGCTETGVTTMQMDEGLDTGDILLMRAVPIGEDDNFETVHDRLGQVGAALLIETLHGLADGTVKPKKQPEAGVSYAAKIEKADCELNFSEPARAVHDRIRALSPVPLAFAHTPDGKRLKVFQSRVSTRSAAGQVPGTVLALDGAVTVACGEGTVDLLGLLPEGKGRMSAVDYINGRHLAVGDVLQ